MPPPRRRRGPRPAPPVRPASHGAQRRESPSTSASRHRFVELDQYRVDREWKRYEGTPQRDLFRELRRRFLERHAVGGTRVLEIGPGPGRFLGSVGRGPLRRVALDLSPRMLQALRATWTPSSPGAPAPDPVRGDALRPPFRPHVFDEVVALGNSLGYAGDEGERLLAAATELVRPGGTFVLEVAPRSGERSRYLRRLPPGAVRRLLVSPLAAVLPRVEREGFVALPGRPGPRTGFRRWSAEEVIRALSHRGWTIQETVAVAPSLGLEPERVAEVGADPRAWEHLLELEERIGQQVARWSSAAAVLVAATSTPGDGTS